MALTRTTYGKLDPETLARMRMVMAQAEAIDAKPSAYSREEIEAMWMKKYRLMDEVAGICDVPPGASWTVDVWTGYVVERED